MTELNFDTITDEGRNLYLSGKKKGLAARETFDLNTLDKNNEAINVRISENIDCNVSFLSGLFSNSITLFGSRSAFLEKYRFVEIPEKVSERLSNVITATLSEGTALSNLKR